MAFSKIILNGVNQIDLTQDTVSDANHIRQGYTGHLNDGTQVTGTYSGSSPNLQAKTNINPTTSSQTIQPDSGYDGLSSVQINAMPSGTAGTPTATKGTVSNHSVSVTPSVTNSTGYITGSTKTGTAVSVSASELVSGTYTVDSSGTKDVTNYASASIPAMTLPSAASSSSSGTSKATITPGSSAQYLNIPTGYNGTAQYYTISATTSGGMNIQAYIGMATKANQAYESTSLTLKVAKTGTYKVSWDGCRSSTSGTNGSRLYINSTAQTAYTTFDATNTRFQHIEMTGVSLTANDQVTVWCRARGTSYYMTVANLIIEQTA